VGKLILLLINMKPEQIKEILSSAFTGPSKWELDNVIWADRTTDSLVLIQFLQRIEHLTSESDLNAQSKQELGFLLELLEDLDDDDCAHMLNPTEEEAKDSFIEKLARASAIEILTNGRLGFETMNTACKLSPNDFILCAKRTQDLITAIQGLVVKGETLSTDVAGA
jgi:hypothetical protein